MSPAIRQQVPAGYEALGQVVQLRAAPGQGKAGYLVELESMRFRYLLLPHTMGKTYPVVHELVGAGLHTLLHLAPVQGLQALAEPPLSVVGHITIGRVLPAE